ncbi:hypothetical protein JG688_00006431, partial [Phytophthora aleatoria]
SLLLRNLVQVLAERYAVKGEEGGVGGGVARAGVVRAALNRRRAMATIAARTMMAPSRHRNRHAATISPAASASKITEIKYRLYS